MLKMLVGCTLLLSAAALALPPPIQITGAYAVQPPPGTTVIAAYVQLQAQAADRLRGGHCTCAKRVEVHAHSHVDGVMRMRKLDALDLPPDVAVTLEPGGLHLMLFEVEPRPEPGQRLTIGLDFEQAGMVAVEFEVRDGRKAVENDPHAGHH